MPKNIDSKLKTRLAPLYVAAFFHGLVLWYVIEKLFMKTIGYTDATIGVMIAFYSAIMLIAETPSGILADRWSRKGVLILASICLALSSLAGGLSNSVLVYLISAAFWGIFFALYSGTYDSIIYDTVLEETNKSERYQQYYGRIKVMDSTALVLGSLAGGVLANYAGLRWTYYLTVPISLFAIVALLKFKEPTLHKSHVAAPIKQHILNTFGAVLKRGQLVPIMISTVTVSALGYLVFEFAQLWVIALAAPVLLYGPINALFLSTIGLGGIAVNRLKLHEFSRMAATVAIMMFGSLGMVFSRNLTLTVLSITLLSICLISATVVFSQALHDSLDSKVRAGASSAVSTLGRMLIIPIALGFGYISSRYSVFSASWILVALVAMSALAIAKTYINNSVTPVLPSDTLASEEYVK